MPRTPAPLRTAGALLRALLGLALLLALIAGVPYLLLAVGHQPTELTGGLSLLMEQDDGSLFLVVLTCLGWASWALFTLSALIETVAVLRRRSAPRIKGLGNLQSLASVLIGGIVLLAPTAASAATGTPAVAVTAVHTVGDSGTTATPGTPAATPAEETDWPQHTVASATELPWDLAEEYLGDGKRWKDIAALNPEIPQLASGDQYLPKDAVIKLPADARPVTPATASAPQTSKSPQTQTPQQTTGQQNSHRQAGDTGKSSVTVRPGDSLWSIADAHGDPEDWPAIYEANKGQATPGGGHFDNPNLIYPGQELDLPAAEAAVTPPAEQTPHSPADPGTTDRTPPAQPDTHKPAPDPAPDKSAEADKPTAAPTPTQTARPAPSTDRTPAPVAHTSDDTALAPAALWAGAGGLAAAVIGTLATRRILQQRRRRPGRRIPMPTGRAAATEQSLRAAQHPTGFELLDTALRSLALNLAAAGRELPVIDAVVLHDAKVELHLAEETPPMRPFSQTAGRTDLWVCPASSPDLADDEQLKEADAPYPALVSIGWDGAGHLVLVDLERVGILNLAGDPDLARQVLQAIAVELASTPLPGHLEVTALTGTAPGLDTAAPERVVRTGTLTEATSELTSHHKDQRHALAAVGANSLRAARLMDDAAGAWTPHILLAESLSDAEDTQITTLCDTLAEEPRTASAVITADTTFIPPTTAWTLTCQGPDHTISLPGSHLPVKLQGLSDEHFADAIELLTLAASDADVPAPDWTRADTGDQEDSEEPQEPPTSAAESTSVTEPAQQKDEDPTSEADDDGLPTEYADPEPDTGDDASVTSPEGAEAVPAHTVPAQAATTDLTKNQTRTHEDDPQDDEPAGPTLAEVLAADAEPNGTSTQNTASMPADGAAATAHAQALRHTTPAIHVTLSSPAADPSTAHDPIKPAAEAPEEAPGTETTDHTPAVRLLGPISIEGARGRIDSNRRAGAVELITFLALNPSVDHHAVDDALWPGRLVNKQMRNAVISRTRSWLGKDTDGKAHLPRVQDTGDSRYRLGPDVTCDWKQFQRFARTGLALHDEDGDLALRRALALVRGRPFTGIDSQRYAWAEPIIQEMVSAIVDVAYELSERRREAVDIPGALWAARRGMLAAEESEMLHRQVFLAHHAVGDIEALRAAATRLTRINEQLLGGVDMEAETAELLRNLLPRPVTRAR